MNKPKKIIGCVTRPFSLRDNPEYVKWLEQQNANFNAYLIKLGDEYGGEVRHHINNYMDNQNAE